MLQTTDLAPVVYNQLPRFYKQVDVHASMGKDYAAGKPQTDLQYEDLLTEHIEEEPITPTEDARSLASDNATTWPHVPELTA